MTGWCPNKGNGTLEDSECHFDGYCSECLNGNKRTEDDDVISRQATINAMEGVDWYHINKDGQLTPGANSKEDEPLYKAKDVYAVLNKMPSAQPDQSKYEYHYDHTDCIWYRPEARNRCPVTCAQYRDGWNDAMNYIFRNGKGYRPYRRDTQYGE